MYPTADAAVAAAEAAFQAFRTRPLDDRKKAVDCIRKICVEQAEELGRMELEETKIGRLDHKIAKLRDAIPRVPGVEYLRTENVSGDDGHHPDRLRAVRRHRRDHAGDAQPADAGGQRDQHAGLGQHGRLQRPSLGGEGRRRGGAPVQPGDPRRRSGSTTC